MQRSLEMRLRKAALLVTLTLLPFACRGFAIVTQEGASGAPNGGKAGEGGSPESGAGGQSDAGQAGRFDAGVNGGEGGVGGGTGEGGLAGAPVLEPLEPLDFERLTLWLEATSENCSPGTDSSAVIQWRDGSNNGNHAESQDAARRPIFTEDILNHHGVVSFEATVKAGVPDEPSSLVVADDASLALGREDFVALAVARWSNGTALHSNGSIAHYWGSGSLVTRRLAAFPRRGIDLLANYPPSAVEADEASSRFAVELDTKGACAVSFSDGLNDNVFRLYVGRRAGEEIGLRINGVVEGRSHIAKDFHLDEGYVLGASENLVVGGVTARPFVGDIAELVLIRGKTSDAQLAALEAHLMTKYALVAP